MPRILGPDEIAEALIISRDTAEDLIRKIPHFQANPGSKRPMWRVTEDDLKAWINSNLVIPNEQKRVRSEKIDRSLFEQDGRIKRR